jgi:hypothetical protein
VVVVREVVADGFALLGVGLAGHRGAEEEYPEDGEKDEELQDDKPDEWAAPGLVPETIPIEMPYFFCQSSHHFAVSLQI